MLDADDVTALLSEVDAFATQRIAAAVERPEAPISHHTLAALSAEAAELGLLPAPGADPGYTLWEHCDHANAMQFNLGLLQLVARANAGIAFAWHRAALARAAAAPAGAPLAGAHPAGTVLDTAIVTTGHLGLARAELARFLRPQGPRADGALLSDWLDRRQHPTTVITTASWQHLVWPVWHDDTIRWQRATRQQLQVEPCRAQHGLDELAAFRVRLAPDADATLLPGDGDTRLAYERVLKLDMLGLMAIGAGALRHAWELAAAYAAIRKQGGKVIGEHPAVQIMLGEMEMAWHQASGALARFARPLDDIALSELAAQRVNTHGALCHGANQGVQVHGGVGYMRDVGAEKIVRDQNMLRLQAGGTREIPLLLSGLCGGQP
ncbi:MAG TPA: acyl-CoA dehydrogenase family protein [Burkholderiaceae bacterium]|nr:acyl-CoA dehydrogenase family protein [Burkholderiaceae bacterium]